VETAAKLPVKGVTSLHYFGRDLVLFRGAGGNPYLMDAYCPHLGVGSRVDADGLRCTFHGWRFQGESGRCDDVPYDDIAHIPRTAATRSYPTIERNQMIWAWHHGADEPPSYEVPEVEEFTSPDFQSIVVREFEVATCAQEMSENNVDTVISAAGRHPPHRRLERDKECLLALIAVRANGTGAETPRTHFPATTVTSRAPRHLAGRSHGECGGV
jgi:nitrite reductase/ring-hydroxylating ferredoxin subunit